MDRLYIIQDIHNTIVNGLTYTQYMGWLGTADSHKRTELFATRFYRLNRVTGDPGLLRLAEVAINIERGDK